METYYRGENGPIPVGFAFKRPYEGGHGNQSHDGIYTVERMKICDRR